MFTRWIILAVLAPTLCGCASTQDFAYKQSHRISAYYRSICTGNAPLLNTHYKDGWRAGYFDYSTGRRCKPPTLPPSKYWSSCYQSCEGQHSIEEWYRGYQLGMLQAEKICGNCWHQIRPRTDCDVSVVTRSTFAEAMFEVPPPELNDAELRLIPQSEAIPVPSGDIPNAKSKGLK